MNEGEKPWPIEFVDESECVRGEITQSLVFCEADREAQLRRKLGQVAWCSHLWATKYLRRAGILSGGLN